MNQINLGCGDDYRDGWTNVDYSEEFSPDDEREGQFLCHDLEETPWPFETDEFDYALADNVFEHIDPRRRPAFLKECHRILRQGGKLVMRLPTPGYGGGWDVTHYSIPSWEWPDHPDNDPYWEMESISFDYTTVGKVLPKVIAEKLLWHGIRVVTMVELVVVPQGVAPETK